MAQIDASDVIKSKLKSKLKKDNEKLATLKILPIDEHKKRQKEEKKERKQRKIK